MPRTGMYTPETMARNLSQGNIAEAMLRLWVEKHQVLFTHTTVIQTGYNPQGIVQVAQKPWLIESSDPDFALVSLDANNAPGRALYGVSVNAQQRLYNIQSTSGGLCSVKLQPHSDLVLDERCTTTYQCFTSQGSRLWYNRPNIENDYPRFQAKTGAIDTILISFVSTRPANFAKSMKRLPAQEKADLEETIWDYLKNGITKARDKEKAASFARRLEYGNRVNVPVLSNFGIRWYLLSEIQQQQVPFWITGGLSDNGRPPKKYCLPAERSHDEQALVAFLRKVNQPSVT